MLNGEPLQIYEDALRRGRKEYRGSVGRGEYPYLPSLARILPPERMSMGSYVGCMEIPLELVSGTVNDGRTTAFSRDFLPLLPTGTEFAMKWQNLCAAHLDIGIRDAIKVIEYMNRYYVQEGNKRVSVLKYFGASGIAAEVTRIMPERDGSEEVARYLEHLAFVKKSHMLQLELTERGGYARLQAQLGLEPDEEWPEALRSKLRSLWERFRTLFLARAVRSTPFSCGDALLQLLELYDLDSLQKASTDELKRRLIDAWPELQLKKTDRPIDLKLDPEKEKKPGLVEALLGRSTAVKSVAFLYGRGPESKWVQNHEEGRLQAQHDLYGRVTTRAYFLEPDESPEALLERAIAEKPNVIFTTTPALLPASLKAAAAHPEIMLFNCSVNTAHHSVRSYYARMYEIKFISGAIAGCIAGGKDIGYVADYPIYGQIAGINAFAAGVALTDPNARVILDWSCLEHADSAEDRLRAKGVELISSLEAVRLTTEDSAYGLYTVTADGTRTQLATPVWQWGTYYRLILTRILDGSLQAGLTPGKAPNYYWGLRAGVVDIELSDRLPDGTRKLAELLRSGLLSESCAPFAAPIYAQGAREAGLPPVSTVSLDMERIIGMDWLAENVVGSIPAYDRLTPAARRTAAIVGVGPARGGNA